MKIIVILRNGQTRKLTASGKHTAPQLLHLCAKRNIHKLPVITESGGFNFLNLITDRDCPQIITFRKSPVSDGFDLISNLYFNDIIVSGKSLFADAFYSNRNISKSDAIATASTSDTGTWVTAIAVSNSSALRDFAIFLFIGTPMPRA